MAAGCAFYLEFAVAGQPEMGRSPLPSSVIRAKEELKLPGFALPLADARRVAQITGATQVAVGMMQVTGGSVTITYTIHDAGTGVVIGSPISISGAPAGLIHALPEMANQMSQRLGVPISNIPSTLETSPEEMEAVGRSGWSSSTKGADAKMIADAAPHFAAAMLIKLRSETMIPDFGADSVLLLTTLAPNNQFAWVTAAAVETPFALIPSRQPLHDLRTKFPDSYPLAHAEGLIERREGDLDDSVKAEETAAYNAPANPDAWIDFGAALGEDAGSLRGARTVGQITPDEWAKLNPLYARWVEAMKKGVHIDPQHQSGWLQLSRAETFCGVGKPREAYLKAEIYSQNMMQVYRWGLQMFQPKWGGDPADLLMVANHAAAYRNYPDLTATGRIIADLRELHFDNQANQLLHRYADPLLARITINPRDAQAHRLLALLYAQSKMTAEALAEYKIAETELPTEPDIHFEYGDTFRFALKSDEAVKELELADDLHSNALELPRSLAVVLLMMNKASDAEKFAKRDVERRPGSYESHFWLAEAEYRLGRHALAFKEESRAIELGLQSPHAYGVCAYELIAMKQPANALAFAKRGLEMFGNDRKAEWPPSDLYILHAGAGTVFLKGKQYADARDQFQVAVALQPDGMYAHYSLGSAYNELGLREEARKEWQLIVDKNTDKKSIRAALARLKEFPPTKKVGAPNDK